MKKVVLLVVSLFTFGLFINNILADEKMSDYEIWCYSIFDGEELEKCLDNEDDDVQTRAGCL